MNEAWRTHAADGEYTIPEGHELRVICAALERDKSGAPSAGARTSARPGVRAITRLELIRIGLLLLLLLLCLLICLLGALELRDARAPTTQIHAVTHRLLAGGEKLARTDCPSLT